MSYGTVQAEKMTTESGYSLGAGNASSFKNRIINGGMTIDQRNAGAGITPANGAFMIDRFQYEATQASKVTSQQNQGSVTPPAGFINYLGITSSSAYSVTSTDIFGIRQIIEGYNIADLGWGTASAKAITLSFWVRSSLTGTFGGALGNQADDRSYPFSYTISSANTWEQKSITIAGDTTGTWLTTNGRGIQLRFGLGTGSTYSGTAGAWSAGYFISATGATSVVGTSGATFYITGVQLEVGTVATSFDYRPYGTELALCQRYCPVWTYPTANSNAANTYVYSTGNSGPLILSNPVAVRSPVTGITVSAASQFSVSDGDSSTACSALSLGSSSILATFIQWTTGSGRTTFRPHYMFNNTAGAFIIGNGCEL